jgi:hypothetical protein
MKFASAYKLYRKSGMWGTFWFVWGVENAAAPALKRIIRVEILSRSAEALLPPHECGAPTKGTLGCWLTYEIAAHRMGGGLVDGNVQ